MDADAPFLNRPFHAAVVTSAARRVKTAWVRRQARDAKLAGLMGSEAARAVLPNNNLASNPSQFLRTVASQVDDMEIFGSYAIGGCFQIYVPDVSILKPIP